MNPVDQWLAINAKYFNRVRQRLEALPEQLPMLYSILLPLPLMMLSFTFWWFSWNRPLYFGTSWSWCW